MEPTIDDNMSVEMNVHDDIINNIINENILSNNNVPIGFDSKSNSIKYYENENEEKGMGAKYLIANAFELSKDSYKKIQYKKLIIF